MRHAKSQTIVSSRVPLPAETELTYYEHHSHVIDEEAYALRHACKAGHLFIELYARYV